jgi:hypothetical protein
MAGLSPENAAAHGPSMTINRSEQPLLTVMGT